MQDGSAEILPVLGEHLLALSLMGVESERVFAGEGEDVFFELEEDTCGFDVVCVLSLEFAGGQAEVFGVVEKVIGQVLY